MHAIIADGEGPDRRWLRDVLRQVPAVARIHACANGRDAARLLKRSVPDVVFLDTQMPDVDAFLSKVVAAAASGKQRPPVIVFVTAFDERAVRAFQVQAADYFAEPSDNERMNASSNAATEFLEWMRRYAVGDHARDGFGDITVNFTTRVVRRAARPVQLRPAEYALLVALLKRLGRAASRPELLREVWGYAEDVMSRTVDTHIAMLRRKLEQDPHRPRHIVTVRKFGYRIER